MAHRRTMTRMTIGAVAFVVLATAACESPEAVRLWNPKTDHVVTCEPAPDHAQYPDDPAAKQADCVEHYKGLGFIEVAAPQ